MTALGKLMASYEAPRNETCEHCGHEIKQIFVVDIGGRLLHVGSECVKQITEPAQAARVERHIARMKRAASQWRNQKPAANPGESRDQYITRRVAEMGNARRAWIARNGEGWRVFEKAMIVDEDEVAYRVIRMISGVERDEFRTLYRKDGIYGTSNAYPVWTAVMSQVSQHREAKFAKKYGANPFDYSGRTAWDVTKI